MFFRKISLFLVVSFSCFASPVIDLYNDLGVGYSRDCTVSGWYAYYQVNQDKIHLRRSYQSKGTFHHCALHELCHWARADHRMGPLGGSYRTPDDFEEVMCDLVAMVLVHELGISGMPEDEIEDYIERTIGNRRMTQKDWHLILSEAHQSIEYLLKRPISLDTVKTYLQRVIPIA